MASNAPTCTHCGTQLAGTWAVFHGEPFCDNGRCGMNHSRAKRGKPPKPPFAGK